MVDEAVGPGEKVDTGWGRALVSPDTGSALELGQGFLEVFFFEEDHVPESGLELCPAWELGGVGDTVDVEEVDPREEEELDL